MANEYNELEQLVNDVTNIDTARMTLRWALERLNSIEKEKAELKKSLTLAENARGELEVKTRSLEETFASRAKDLNEKEGFYGKLEATMALLGEGKLNIQQLIKKEAKLDHLRKELEEEYQEKFVELDKSQNSIIERWNQRLLEVESQYAKRISEAQVRYDALKQDLEADYQARLGTLEKSYQHKEKELHERIRGLEASVKGGEDKLEGRRKELEAELIAKKSEIEENYRRLRSVLETNFEERVSSIDGDHSAQVKALEKTWNAERERLLEEQRIRDEQALQSQTEISKLEAELSAQQEKHHAEMLAIINTKEEAFRGKIAELEREKTEYEAGVRKLMAQLEQKEKDWVTEKEKLRIQFDQRCADIDVVVKERVAVIEKDFEHRKEDLNTKAAERIEKARRVMAEEMSQLVAENELKETALQRAYASIKELEETIVSSGQEHQSELMEKIRANEENFRAKLEEFEAEKARYNSVIERLAEESRNKDSVLLAEKERLQKEFQQKYALLEAELELRDVKDEDIKASYDARIARLQSAFEEKEKAWTVERENLSNEFARVSESAQAMAAERLEKMKTAYETRLSELHGAFEAREKEWSVERERLTADLAQASEGIEALALERVEKIKAAYETRLAGLAGAYEEKEKQWIIERDRLSAELTRVAAETQAMASERIEKMRSSCDARIAEMESSLEEKEKGWVVERERFSSDLARLAETTDVMAAERVSKAKAEYEMKKAELQKRFEEKARDQAAALEFERQRVADELAAVRAELAAAGERAKELEGELSEDRRRHHEDLMAKLAEKEAALKLQAESFEKELVAKDDRLYQASLEFSLREKRWAEEKEKLSEEFAGRFEVLENSLREREAVLENQYRLKAAELDKSSAEVQELLETDFKRRLSLEKQAFDEAKARLAEELALREAEALTAHEKVKELEGAIGELKNAHHEELMAKMQEKDSALRAAADQFEREIAAYGERMADLNRAFDEKSRELERSLIERTEALKEQYKLKTADLNRKAVEMRQEFEAEFANKLALERQGFEEAKNRFTEELQIKDQLVRAEHEKIKELETRMNELAGAHHEELLEKMQEKDVALRAAAEQFEREKAAYNEQLSTREKKWASEKESLSADFAQKFQIFESAFKEREAALEEQYRVKIAEIRKSAAENRQMLESDFARRLAMERQVFEDTRARINEELKLKDALVQAEHEKVKELEGHINELAGAHHEELMAKMQEKEAALRAAADKFEQEKAAYEEQLAARERKWTAEKESLSADFARKFDSLENSLKERENALEEQYRVRVYEMKKGASEAQQMLEADFDQRLSMERQALEESRARIAEEMKMKDALVEAEHAKVKELENHINALTGTHHEELMAKMQEKDAALRAAADQFEHEKAEYNSQLADLNLAFADKTKMLESSIKAREAALEEQYKLKLAELDKRNAANQQAVEAEFARRMSAERQAVEELRHRFAEELALKDAQAQSEHAKVKELEKRVGELSKAHHEELMAKMQEKEAALRAAAAQFEREKTAFAAQMAELNRSFADREKKWASEKELLSADFAQKFQMLEHSLKEREGALEDQYRVKLSEMRKSAVENRQMLEADFDQRLAAERQALEESRTRIEEELKMKEALVQAEHERTKELEKRVADITHEHHEELLAKVKEKDAALRSAAGQFELEKAAFAAQINDLNRTFAEREKEWVLEREELNHRVLEAFTRIEGTVEERVSAVKADYEERKARLEKVLGERLESERGALKFELEKIQESGRVKDGKLAAAHDKISALEQRIAEIGDAHHEDLMAKIAEKEAALKAQAEGFAKELKEKDAAIRAAQQGFAMTEKKWAEEKERLSADFAEKFQSLENSLVDRESALEEQYKLKVAEMKKAAAEMQHLMETDFARRAELDKQGIEEERARLAEEVRIKDDQVRAERAKTKELEERIEEVSRIHHEELMAKMQEKEAFFRARTQDFEKEKQAVLRAMDELKSSFAAEKDRWVQQKETLASDFAAKYAALEASIKDRADMLEADYAAKRDAFSADLLSKEEALNREVDARIAFERAAAQAQVRRAESMLAKTVEELEKVQREAEATAAKNMDLNEKLAAKDATMSREVIEIKAACERDLSLRLKDALAAHTAHLARELEAAKKKHEESVSMLDYKESEIRRLKADMADKAAHYEELIKNAENTASSKKAQELESLYKQRKARLEGEMEALKAELQAEERAQAEELAAEFDEKSRRVMEENAALKKTMDGMRQEVAQANARANSFFNDMMDKVREHQDEIIKLRETQAGELNDRLNSAVAKATETLQEKLRFMESEIAKAQAGARSEMKAAEESMRKEKERLQEELARKEDYIEVVDFKIQEMENELMKYRQNAANIFMGQVAEQEEKFKTVVKEYQARQEKAEKEARRDVDALKADYEARLAELQESLRAKEKVMRDGGEFWKQKQADIDAQYAELNRKITSFNEELFAQKQALTEKDKQANAYRLGLEKEYAVKMDEIEKLKLELTRTIMEYKNRKK